MKKAIIHLALAVALTTAAHAEAVYMSAHGKTFHKSGKCMSLARAQHVYSAERDQATGHGLHQCSICYREKKAGAVTGAASWATETPKAGKSVGNQADSKADSRAEAQ